MSRTVVHFSGLSDPANLIGVVSRALAPYEGQRLLGVVDGGGWVEVVFDANERGVSNLFSFRVESDKLEYATGDVDGPSEYVADYRNPPKGEQ